MTDIDWENRRLCSDGNCIGVIGPDGRCKECGRPDEAEDAGFEPADPSDSQHPPEDAPEGIPPSGAGEPPPGARDPGEDFDSEGTPEDSDWENRRLCSDGNCIGVIGPDGRCKECGRPEAGGS